MRALPDGDVTFLLTDIEASTALFRALGDAWAPLLATHNELLRAAVDEAGGVELKSGGDGFIFAFADPTDALAAAIDGQRALAAHSWGPHEIRVRMGVHRGEAKVVDDDYVSFALHQAARILSAANGGQVIVSPAIDGAQPEFAQLTELGEFHVRDFDEVVVLRELRHPDLPVVQTPVRAASAIVHNLPPQRTSFVGRDFEVAELTKQVTIDPLTTIVGTGGIGKTRLAAEAGRQAAKYFPGGVWLVQLARVAPGADVIDAIAEALRLDATGDAADVVRTRLGAARTLVLLDNCEHVIGSAAEVVDVLLESCPETAILATSREPLAVDGEHVMRLAPLPLPSGDAADGACVELFVQRATQASPGFVLDDRSAPHVAEICRLLDGIPLAIELVAAQVWAASLEELASQVAEQGALDASRRGGDARQRTLRSAIAWSLGLVSDDARGALLRASVFRGGFTREAAEAVCAVSDVDVVLDELVNRSLLEVDPSVEPPRYRMLEPVRDLAADELGDATSALDALVGWVITTFPQPGDDIVVLGVDDADRPVPELANIRVALEHAVNTGRGSDAVAITQGLTVYFSTHGATQWIEICRRVADLEMTRHERGQICDTIGTLAVNADLDLALRYLDEAAAIWEELGNNIFACGTLITKAREQMHHGRPDDAARTFEVAREFAKRVGDPSLDAICAIDAAMLAFYQADERAEGLLLEAAGLPHVIDIPGNVAPIYGTLTAIALNRRDTDRALAYARLARADAERANTSYWIGMSGVFFAWVSMAKGDLEQAKIDVDDALVELRKADTYVSTALATLAAIHVRRGDIAAARATIDEAVFTQADARAIALVRSSIEWRDGNRDRALEIRGALARAGADGTVAERVPAPIDLVMEELGGRASEEAAWKRGYERSLENVLHDHIEPLGRAQSVTPGQAHSSDIA